VKDSRTQFLVQFVKNSGPGNTDPDDSGWVEERYVPLKYQEAFWLNVTPKEPEATGDVAL
jgi:hypothetical protein